MNMQVNPNLSVVNDVTPYEGDTSRAWIRIEEKTSYVKMTGLRSQLVTETRSALLDGKTEELQVMTAQWKRNGMTGRVVIREMIESELPVSFVENVKNPDRYAKIAGDSGIPCTIGGERIFRFAAYDPSGKIEDVLLQHDNGEAIRSYNAAKREAAVELEA